MVIDLLQYEQCWLDRSLETMLQGLMRATGRQVPVKVADVIEFESSRAFGVIIKCQFGYRKTRYKGLIKNTAQIVTLIALSNVWLVRNKLRPIG